MRLLTLALVGLLLWPVPAWALDVGDRVRITEESRDGRITAKAKRGTVKFQSDTGLTVGYETQSHYTLLETGSPGPTPPPEPPQPGPNPAPEPPVTIPLTIHNLPEGVSWPVSGGIPMPRGLVHDCAHLRVLTQHRTGILTTTEPRPFGCEPLDAHWPDGSLKSVKLTVLAQAGEALLLSVTAPGGVGSEPSKPVTTPSLPGQLQLSTVEKITNLPITFTASEGRFRAPDGTTSLAVDIEGSGYAGIPGEIYRITAILDEPELHLDTNPSTYTRFEAESYTWEIPGQFTTYAIGGDNGQVYTGTIPPEGVSLYQGGESVWQNGSYRGVTQWYDGAGTGTAAPGWACAGGAGGGSLCVTVEDFADQFPKGYYVFPDRLVVAFHPQRASLGDGRPRTSDYQRPTRFYLKSGQAKTYRVLYTAGVDPAEFATLAGAFQAGPRLSASREWLTSSGAFRGIGTAQSTTVGYDRFLIDGILTPSSGPTSLIWLKGWRDHGDRLRPGWAYVDPAGVRVPSFYNDTHVGAGQFFTEWLRTGNEAWWRLAEQATRHFMDLDVSHSPRRGYWKDDYTQTPTHDYVATPAGEGHLIKHEVVDHTSRNLHWGHAHLSGLPDYVLLTGDRRAAAVLREVGDWWVAVQPGFFPVPTPSSHYAEAERDYAWPLFVLNEAYRATGDVRYHRAACLIVQHLVGWWQQPAEHWARDQHDRDQDGNTAEAVLVGRTDWTQGTGWWAMAPHLDNDYCVPKRCTGTNPWMAGALLAAVIDTLEADADHGLLDRPLVKTMILQTLNYVVTHGWETSRKWKDYDYFVYSESARETAEGLNHLLYPLAWGAREVQRGVEHPEQYPTYPTWVQIVKERAADWQIVKHRGTTALGFYGYEFIRPEFWAIAPTLRDDD